MMNSETSRIWGGRAAHQGPHARERTITGRSEAVEGVPENGPR